MSIGTSVGLGLAVAGGIGAAGSVASGLIGASAAGNAASTQAQSADEAAQLQYQSEQQALAFQEQEFAQEQSNIQPWLQTGGSAEMEMAQLLGLPPASGGGTPARPFSGTNATTPPGQATAPQPVGPNGPLNINSDNPIGARNASTLNMSRLTQPNGAPGAGTSPWPTMTGSVPQNTVNAPAGGVTARTGGLPANGPGQLPANSNPNASNLSPFAPWTTPFQAPTLAQAEQNPGYQFELQQGENALTNQASATGELGDSNYGRGLVNYAENAAQTDYQQVYNNSLQQYQQSYNIYQNNQANQWNRLASLAGMGQTSAGQLNSAGSSAAGNVGNILLGSGQQIGNSLQNAGAATASGYVGAANAYGGALGNIGNIGSTLSMMSLLNPTSQVPIDQSWMPSNPVMGQPYYPGGSN